jgi:hypothetical protein
VAKTLHITCSIDKAWDGRPIPDDEIAVVDLSFGPDAVRIVVTAPFHDDPPPPVPAGPSDGLWNYQVVEVFLLGSNGYIEIELGPHGHYLVLDLGAPRVVRRKLMPIEYAVTGRNANTWTSEAVVPNALLPAGLDRFNAYRVHGTGKSRRHFAAFPVPGDRPDFHRLECFGALVPKSADSRT